MDDFFEDIDSYLKSLDIDIAQQEKIGAAFLSIGYAIFFAGADLDISEALFDYPPNFPTDIVTLFGQILVLIGYIILFLVNRQRITEKILINELQEEEIILWPYILITNAYLLSIFANTLRLIGFYYIVTLESK